MAARSRWAQVEALQCDRAFQEAYQVALKQWLAGLPAVFPTLELLMATFDAAVRRHAIFREAFGLV